MVKIGILTFQNAYNYGAALQAYALKSVIGDVCEIINYNNEYFSIKNETSLKRKIIKAFYNKQLKKRVNRFHEFQHQFLVGNQSIITDSELKSINDKYGLFITGSDQVWNLETSGYNTAYFLDFVDDSKKKNSYAASFGSENLSDNNLQISKDLLKDFNNISVREKSGQKIIKTLTGRDVPVVLDPTMLLSASDWNKLINNPIHEKKYVLLYTVLNGDKIVEFAKNLANSMGVELYCITTSLKPQSGMKCIRDAGPLEWLNLMKNADAIVTNSFHGLAFSLIYNKQFYIELLPPPSQTNARIKELLENVQLTDRIINMDVNKVSNIRIDYNNVNMIWQTKRQESLSYLKQIVSK